MWDSLSLRDTACILAGTEIGRCDNLPQTLSLSHESHVCFMSLVKCEGH